MKRNFLLMLLLTLLPFAGWSADPQLTGLIDGTNAWVIGSQELPGVEESGDYVVEGYYDSNGFPVSVITEVGWYFVKVVDESGENSSYVAFQAWKEWKDYDYIINKSAWETSCNGRGLSLYYAACDAEVNIDDGIYPEDIWNVTQKRFAMMATDPATGDVLERNWYGCLYAPYGNAGQSLPWIISYFPANNKETGKLAYQYGNQVVTRNKVITAGKEDYGFFSVPKHFTDATGYGIKRSEEKVATNSGTGGFSEWIFGVTAESDLSASDVAESTFEIENFHMYVVPSDEGPDANGVRFKELGKTYNVNVSGVNGQSKVYGDALVLNTSLITTNQDEINGNPALMEEIVSKLQIVYDLKYEPVANHKEYVLKLAEGVIPTVATKVGNDWEYTYGTDYIDVVRESYEEIPVVDRYIIKPTGEGHVDIIAATDNELKPGLVYTDLVYNGKPQILINKPAEATYGDVVYYASDAEVTDWSAVNAAWVTSADIKGTNAGNYYVYAKVEETAEFNGIEPTLLSAPTVVDGPNGPTPGIDAPGPAVIAKFDLSKVDEEDAAKYKPTGNTWSYDGQAHNIAKEPAAMADMPDLTVKYATAVDAEEANWKTVNDFKATKNADPKKVFWQIVANDNIEAVAAAETNWVEATINKAEVTLALEDGKTKIALDPTSYWYKGGAEIAIGTPSGVTYTPNNLGGELKYFIEKLDGEVYNPVTDNKVTAIGKYRYNAKFVGNDDVADAGPMPDAQCATFEVVRPSVAINTTATPGVVGVGAVPTCGWTPTWADKDHTDKLTAPANVTYMYYRVRSNGIDRNPTDPSNFQVGRTYQVRVSLDGFSTEYTDVVAGTWATFTVASSQIEAEIEPGTFAYGQLLPLTIKYVSGFGEGEDAAEDIEAFNEATRYGKMKAKMIKDAEGNAVTDAEEITLNNESGWKEGAWRTLTTVLPVGTYRVSANFEDDGQLIITKTAEWTIVPKDITNADVTYDADGNTSELEVWGIGTSSLNNDEFNLTLTYKGAQIVPNYYEIAALNGNRGINYRFTRLAPGDFEIVGPTNKNANINAGEGIFKVVGKGNFTGEKELTFTIAKKEVTARPKPATWAIGSDPAYEVDYEDLYTQLVGKDLKDEDGDSEFDIYTADGFKDIKVRRLAEVNVGTYGKGIEAYLPADATPAQNYDIKPGTAALTIEKGKIVLKLKNVEAVYNGKDLPVIAYDFEPTAESDLSEVMLDNDNWKTVIGTPGNHTWTEADGWNIKFKLDPTKEGDDGRYVAGKTYTIQYDENQTALFGGKTNKELMTSTNYEVTVKTTEATVTITKAPITVTVLDQKNVSVDNVKTALVPKPQLNATISLEPSLKNGDNLTMLFGDNTITVEGNRVLNLEKNQTGFGLNYDVTVVPGNLDVEAYQELLLPSDGTDADIIAAKDNKPYQYIKVVIKPSRMKVNGENNYFDWKEDKWHAMVLPFAASVSQISRAFSFAIVNVVDLDNTKEDHIAFMLPSATATVPANTPFMLKTSKDININGNPYIATFSPKDEDELEEGEVNFYTIEAPKAENTYELPQTDKDPVSQVFIDADDLNLGYKFAGTYDQIIIDKNLSYLRFLNDNNVWSKVGSASTAKFYMAPYAGYINRGEANGTREFIVTFEEEDGSTTAIKAVDFVNGNKANAEGLYRVDGIKVQGATTQKGVYIQDGKKFVK